jgi:hypothetical protein
MKIFIEWTKEAASLKLRGEKSWETTKNELKVAASNFYFCGYRDKNIFLPYFTSETLKK